MSEITIGKTLGIRECGHDEYWLQDKIYNEPSSLGLGDLESLQKERRQSSGGKLDILLKNPEDDSMYEVEVMLGETDESHIIRTIEYWDNEKRKWPQRQHYAVLVAEYINRRFFNVIQLLSHSIPIIAVQVSIVEVDSKKALFFSKILDTYEEIDDGSSINNETYDQVYWKKHSSWTLDTSKALLDLIGENFDNPTLNYVKNYIAISVAGNNYIWLKKRSGNKSLLHFKIPNSLMDEAEELLDKNNISYIKKTKEIRMTVDKKMLSANKELLTKLTLISKKMWRV